MGKKRDDLKGRKFGNWKVISFSHKDKHGNLIYKCQCQICKKISSVWGNNLRSGKSTKCINCRDEERGKNCITKHPEHSRFCGIKMRCYHESHSGYKYYGERDIEICDSWLNDPRKYFEFADINGARKGLQLHRMDNDQGYSPENCIFVTPRINMRASSVAKLTSEKVRTIKAMLKLKYRQNYIAKIFGVDYTTICSINIGRTWVDIPSL